MRIGQIVIRRRVWIGLGFSVIAVGVWWVWWRGHPGPQAAAVEPTRPFVILAPSGAGSEDRILRERAELFDPTPLFFPTVWNYGQRPLRESVQRQPGRVFASFAPKLTYGEQSLKPYGVEAVPLPEKLSDLFVQGNEAPFAGFGEVDSRRPPLPERRACLEVHRMIDGKLIILQALNGFSVPRADFVPLEFLVVVGTAGMVGNPILTSGSGWEDVDAFFRSYLAKIYRLGERLPPGRYRILVGP